MAIITIWNTEFSVVSQFDPALMRIPTQFVFYQGRRVGLYLGERIYFSPGPMEDLFGVDFIADNFPGAFNFFRLNYDGLTPDMIYTLNTRLNEDLLWADNIFRTYHNRDL
jgi:hypothetical protein